MAKGQNVAYVRVSTADQSTARQREALLGCQIDRWFEESISGKDAKRPQLQEMLKYIRDGDTVYVTEFSRLGRSTADLLDIVGQIEGKGAALVSLKESFDTHTPSGRLQMTMLAAISEFERAMILERQAEGIALAKRAGKYKGRKRVYVPNIDVFYDRYMRRELTKTAAAAEIGISRNTLNRLFSEYRNNSKKEKVN